MRKNLFVAILILVFSLSPVSADMIQLKDGRTVKGTIVEKGELEVVIRDEIGRMSRFYHDQISNIIEGEYKTPLVIDASQFENITAEKAGLIIRFIEANGTRAILDKHIQKSLQNVPADKLESFKILFNIDEMVAGIVPVFDKYFSQEDLMVLIEFYESPTGVKMVEVSNDLIQEIAKATVEYFKNKLLNP